MQKILIYLIGMLLGMILFIYNFTKNNDEVAFGGLLVFLAFLAMVLLEE